MNLILKRNCLRPAVLFCIILLSAFSAFAESAILSDFEVQYFHHDHLGNVLFATNRSGNKVWPPVRDPLSDDKGARVYPLDGQTDDVTGYAVFMSPDPVLGNLENPLSWNRYSFCLNNPVRYVDPNGENPANFFRLRYALQRLTEIKVPCPSKEMEKWVTTYKVGKKSITLAEKYQLSDEDKPNWRFAHVYANAELTQEYGSEHAETASNFKEDWDLFKGKILGNRDNLYSDEQDYWMNWGGRIIPEGVDPEDWARHLTNEIHEGGPGPYYNVGSEEYDKVKFAKEREEQERSVFSERIINHPF